MKFLTHENDLIINKDGLLYFYSSEFPAAISSYLFSAVSRLKNYGQTLCIDLNYFNTMAKRFNITEVPTLLIIKDNVEIKRVIGPLSKKQIDDMLGTG